MPALTSIFHEFKEKCIVKNAKITYTRKNDEFLIYVYCQANDVNIKSKENKLKTICNKHGLCYYQPGQIWELPILIQIISVRSTYCSTCVFIQEKKNSFFSFNL